MSTGYKRRKKTIRKLKKIHGPNWQKEYDDFLKDKEMKEHPLIGNLEQILGHKIPDYQKKCAESMGIKFADKDVVKAASCDIIFKYGKVFQKLAEN